MIGMTIRAIGDEGTELVDEKGNRVLFSSITRMQVYIEFRDGSHGVRCVDENGFIFGGNKYDRCLVKDEGGFAVQPINDDRGKMFWKINVLIPRKSFTTNYSFIKNGNLAIIDDEAYFVVDRVLGMVTVDVSNALDGRKGSMTISNNKVDSFYRPKYPVPEDDGVYIDRCERVWIRKNGSLTLVNADSGQLSIWDDYPMLFTPFTQMKPDSHVWAYGNK